MAKPALISLIKQLEATKLNPRNGLPLAEPPVTLFFGSLIEYLGPDHEREKFKYLNELYSAKRDAFQSATGGKGGSDKTEAAAPEPEPEAAPSPATREEAAAPVAGRDAVLEWAEVKSSDYSVRRAAVPGGWLVTLKGTSLAFVPDPRHQWDGGSVE